MKMKVIAILTILNLSAPSFSAQKPALKEKKPISKYYFAQQTNAVCLMVPVMNLEILEQLKQADYNLSKLPAYTRAQWFGILNPFEVSWFKPFANLNFEISNKDPNFNDYVTLKTYIDNGILHGPVLPYFYDENGEFPLGGFFKGLDEAVKLLSLPYMLIDLNGAKDFKLKFLLNLIDITKKFNIEDFRPSLLLPVVQTKEDVNNKKLRVFNQDSKQYEVQDEEKYVVSSNTYSNPETGLEFDFKTFNITKDKKFLDDFSMDDMGDKLFFQTYSHTGIYQSLGGAYKNENSEYVPYMQGIYKMILLTLGINHDNKILVVDGKKTKNPDTYGERDVMISLQNICNADENHPWNKKRFNKDMFLPYVIAEILTKNGKLADQLKQTVDIGFHDWEEYQKLVSGLYYNKNKEQMTGETIAQYIPGEQQALAYALMHNLRFLWYGSQSSEAFYGEIPRIPLVWTFENFVHAASIKKPIKNGVNKKASFLDTWALIRDEIIKNYKRKSWMSFEGHGWVISFDPEIIRLERAKSRTFNDDKLNELLGFAGIESFLSSELKVFYKAPEEIKWEKGKEEIIDENFEELNDIEYEKL